MKDVLAIVGSHPRTRAEMDFTRTDCDIWVFNEAMSTAWATRADAVFQMHAEAIWRNPNNRNDPKHFAWLTGGNTPVVYMQAHYPEVPKSFCYPLDEVVLDLLGKAHFNNKPLRFFNSSIDYAIALGIYYRYKRIEIFGVELETNTEYQYQRAGFAFWTGIAIGRGIELVQHAAMFDAPLYGYEGEVVLEYETFSNRIAELAPTLEEIRVQYEKQQAATGDQFEQVLKSGAKADADKFIELLGLQKNLGQQLSRIDGSVQENERYRQKADAMRDTSGNFLFSRQEFEGAAMDMQKRAIVQSTTANVAGGRCEVVFTRLLKAQKEKHRRKMAGEFMANLQDHFKALFYAALYAGAHAENMAYMNKLDALIKAAGGSKSEEVLLDVERMKNV